MVTRRQAREWALQMLVEFDLNPPMAVDAAIDEFWEQQLQLEQENLQMENREACVIFTSEDSKMLESLATARTFAEERVRGAWKACAKLDGQLEPFLEHWSFYRLGTVERAALRMGAWELQNCPDIPSPIVINEYVDLAKWFSETKSGRFVNGILDRFAKTLAAKPQEFTP